jgi:hypothetical protein
MFDIVVHIKGVVPRNTRMSDVFGAINEVLHGTGVCIKDVERFSRMAPAIAMNDTDLKIAENKVNEKYPDWDVRFEEPRHLVLCGRD